MIAVPICGDEARDAVAVMVRKAAKKAKLGKWISAIYNGEPTITKAKSVL